MKSVQVNNSDLNVLVKIFPEEIRKAVLIRRVEETLLRLFSEGLLNGTVHTCVGQEFAAVFVNKYLTLDDHVVSNHRGHGHYLSRFEDVLGLVGEIMGKEGACCNGVGGSQHLANKNYLSNGIQGGMVPVAAGIALDMKLKKVQNISVAFIGDGTLGEGIIYETFNIASKWDLPFLVVMENNFYSQSTSQKQTLSGDIKKRVEGFGMCYFETDTWDLENLDEITSQAIDYVRTNSKPAFLNIKTYRLNSHSKGDDNRSEIEIEDFHKKDVLNQLINLENDFIQQIRIDVDLEIESIVDKLKKSKSCDINTNDVIVNFKANIIDNSWINNSSKRYNDEIYEVLKDRFQKDETLLLIGEDIENNNQYNSKNYGGAFKVTRDLSNLFNERVLNTPISESSIAGIAIGYAVRGNKSMLEIMFGDFTTLIFDQVLQHASKFQYMFNNLVSCPLVIRTPMGGKRGYGPTHSQSIEKHFIGIPNFGVVALNHRISPKIIYNSIFDFYNSPFMVVENKVLYTRDLNIAKIAGYEYQLSNNRFPSLLITPKNQTPVLTIVCYGEILFDVEQAVIEIFEEEEFLCEIICETLISPVYSENIIESIRKTKQLLIVEEGSGEGGWGSEVIAKLSIDNIYFKKVSRLSNNYIIPSHLDSELKFIPNKDSIINEIKKFI